MARLLGKETDLVCDALLLLKGYITKRHLTSISQLPQNGKAASNSESEAIEQSLIDRLKSIDSVLGRLAIDGRQSEIAKLETVEYDPYKINIPPEAAEIEDEPFLNPFNGEIIFPPSINAPGSSGVKNATDTLEDPNNFAPVRSDAHDENDQAYRHAIETVAAYTPLHIDDSHRPSPFSDKNPFRRLSQRKHSPEISFSRIASFGVSTGYPGMQSTDLQSVLSEFDDIFSEASGESRTETIDTTGSYSRISASSPTISQIPGRLAKILEYDTGVINRERDDDHTGTNPKSADPVEEIKEQLLHHAEMSGKAVTDSRWKEHPRFVDTQTGFEIASKLAEGVQQESSSLTNTQNDTNIESQRELEVIETQIHQQAEQEATAYIARLQAIQDEWNRDYEDSLRGQQILAQQIAEQEEQKEQANVLKEMKRLQELFQAEEMRQIEADRLFAISLSEDPKQNLSGASGLALSLPAPVRNMPPLNKKQTPSTPHILKAFPDKIPSLVPTRPAVSEADRGLGDGHEQVNRLHGQWQAQRHAEPERKSQAAQAARHETQALEAQYRQDLDLTRRLERRLQEEEEQQRQEHQRKQEIQRRQQEADAAEAARKARLVNCVGCGDEHDRDAVYRFACKHAYCRDCLNRGIQSAIETNEPFLCGRNRVDLGAVSRFLSANLATAYAALQRELDTPNPVYCSRNRCSTFVPPSSIKAGVATCPSCHTQTCASCRKAVHAGVCTQDRNGQALLNLGKRKGWKSCPRCQNMVERKDGCLHMTCRCGQDFCYNCGKTSDRCEGTCKR